MIDVQNIPDWWGVKTVSDVCEYIQRGKQPEYDDENGRIKIINQRCIYWDGLRLENTRKLDKESEGDWQEYRYLQYGDVLVNSTGVGTLGRVQIWDVESDDDYVVDGHVTILRSNKKVIPEYLYNFLSSPLGQNQIERYTKGATGQTELYKKHITDIELPLPPLDEQERIMEAVDRRLERVESLKKSVDNVGRLVDEYQDSLTVSLFAGLENLNHSVEIKNLDESIPIDWEMKTFDDVIQSSLYGCNPETGKDIEGVPYLRISDIREDGGLKYIELPEKARFEKDSDRKKYTLDDGDIVIARSGASCGQSYVYQEEHAEMVYASYLIRFKLNQDLVKKNYIREYLRSPIYWEQVTSAEKGAAQNNINAGSIKNFNLPVPPIEKQQDIVSSLREIDYSNVQRASNDLEALFDEYRNSVLRNAFQGDINY